MPNVFFSPHIAMSRTILIIQKKKEEEEGLGKLLKNI